MLTYQNLWKKGLPDFLPTQKYHFFHKFGELIGMRQFWFIPYKEICQILRPPVEG